MRDSRRLNIHSLAGRATRRTPRRAGDNFEALANHGERTLVAQQQNEEMKALTQASNAQNEEVKKISAWAAILFAPTGTHELGGNRPGFRDRSRPDANPAQIQETRIDTVSLLTSTKPPPIWKCWTLPLAK